jgi:mono/diheme cytochrome c family protein/DNA-binding beta-propeller fold protein YncE
MRRLLACTLFLCAAACSKGANAPRPSTVAPNGPPSPPHPKVERVASKVGASVALARIDGALHAWVADEEDHAILTVDVDSGRVVGRTEVGGVPANVVALGDARLAVAIRDGARVAILEGAGTSAWPLAEIATISVATEPVALALSPAEDEMLVASGWGHALSAIDLHERNVRFVEDVGREPRAVAVSTDGKRAFVTHATGPGLSIVELHSSDANAKPKVWNLESESFGVGWEGGGGPFKRQSAQGFAVAVSADPKGRVFVPHVGVHTAFGTNPDFGAPITGYGSADAGPADVFEVAVVDEANGTPIDFEPRFVGDTDNVRVRHVDHNTACLLPRAAIADKANVYIACLDSDRVLELDAGSIHPERMALREWKVPRGPVGLALDVKTERLVVWSSLSRSLSTLGVAESAKGLSLASFTLPAKNPLPAEVARGRELFHSGEVRISGDGRACASCHPDGRDDGLVWATPDGPRQTPSLAGRVDGTAPYGWTGAAKDLESHVPKTFKRLGGKGLTGEDKAALLAYVRVMSAPPVSREARASDEKIAKGKTIFHSEATQCASCHGVDGELPDGTNHDVKSRASGDIKKAFDTPSLKYVGGTGPWFHDGRYKTMRDLLVKSDGKMGHTKHLSPEELDALEAYLLTR